MKSTLASMAFFLTFWSILAEKLTMESLTIGIGVCLGVWFFNYMKKTPIPENLWTFNCIRNIFKYLVILLREIFIANIQVAKVVLSRKVSVTPEVVQFRTNLKSQLARTILANSITLTPGTLTVSIKEDILTVHCLQKEYVEDILNSKFEKILLEIEE